MLRSIKKAFDMVRQQDAETAVTVHTIRMWCKEGKIKCLTAGNKVLVEKLSIEFEEDVLKAYKEETTVLRSKVLTFSELMKEWQANIKANLSISYYLRAQEVGRKFNAFLVEQHLDDKPISVITVRDVQMFLNSFAQKGYQTIPTVKVKKDFPKTVNFRELAREHIITRCSSYGMRRKGYYLAVNIYRLSIFPHSVGQYLKRYEREWKMKEVTCHGLRHTY